MTMTMVIIKNLVGLVQVLSLRNERTLRLYVG